MDFSKRCNQHSNVPFCPQIYRERTQKWWRSQRTQNWWCSLLIYSDISRSKSFQFLTCQQIPLGLKAFTHYLSFRLVCLDSDKTRQFPSILHFFYFEKVIFVNDTFNIFNLKFSFWKFVQKWWFQWWWWHFFKCLHQESY